MSHTPLPPPAGAPAAATALPHRPEQVAAAEVPLRILATTDLHVEILPYDYHADREVEGPALACTATLIAEARAEAANVLLLDNGDLLQGNPMGDLWAQRGMDGGTHPLIQAMNALDYDAATVGNHDFDYGIDFLIEALAGAAFPVVSANAVLALGETPLHDRPLLPPYAVLERRLVDRAGRAHPVRIGVLGLLPPQVPLWDRAVLGDRLVTRDIFPCAAAWVEEMKRVGCDLVVALCHSGIGDSEAHPGQEDAAVPVAGLPGVDAVVAGHSHLVFPSQDFPARPGIDPVAGRIAGKPAVMAGARGSHLGVIDLVLRAGAGGWTVATAAAEVRPLMRAGRAVPPAPAILRLAEAAHAETLRHARHPIGHSLTRITSHFALAAPSAGVALVAEAQARHLERMLAGTDLAGLPILSAAAPFKAGGLGGPQNYTDIPAGDLALRHASDLYIYPNLIAAVRLTGAQIAEWLERAASIFAQLAPGIADQPLIDPTVPSYTFDLIHGLDFTIDPSEPARYDAHGQLLRPEARRIRGLARHGRAVDAGDAFVVATNSYRAGASARLFGEVPVWSGSDSIRDILIRHIAGTSPIAPVAPAFWRLAPVPGASAILLSAPDPAPPPPGLRLTRLAPDTAGFSRFRLAL
ncbi:bifunctional 2',3'-cyclic-nucleotide 2'-phosphodiesterase/3'-nucleotidase [Cereibacter sphaeroides]|uniref:bifunctional 2',3'-cyclic-nucleotide 2'-phosphodiesterase/3'-nucleotidase n=1 Tax=Cereibacter sphaeroides TaxID=1063 RepID=UPI001F3929EB|nr:bifunctional 2',3'-cyclic-nucleotide 2'-phosphodiesterase/3'-nucleotidase [Cereibacter sphaeroides]MCE6959450.1 bifunctional 2',3'-cyclic-nucleotide 2'-phosphodiesterase/3'-nucleotidase [Cereibacter sphaeroides]MCE6968277.1 bifunctional 2',3'-cyclic-nucleotide 2'-phosphodiesterase/3'-nucleotidase [Cereibacter sphaeroides]MCE6973779.1 bifunctional 2',3'-cyclic-nucleotide 2'-phosphodiesterase/3'-nucleotidase [Cereibacter sphaeroides]